MDTCRTCDMPLKRTGRPGRPAAYCDNDCRIKGGARAVRARGLGRKHRPCGGCAKPMQVTATMAEHPMCHPCRRARAEAAKAQRRTGPWHKSCALTDCHNLFLAMQPSRRFCSQDCLLSNHRAMERIRDAERRRMRQAEQATEALCWRGDREVNYMVAGPPVTPVLVKIRTTEGWSRYDIRCPECNCLCSFIAGTGDPGAWACYRCYLKYALLSPPTGMAPEDYSPGEMTTWHAP